MKQFIPRFGITPKQARYQLRHGPIGRIVSKTLALARVSSLYLNGH
jgi:hypothetical protein